MYLPQTDIHPHGIIRSVLVLRQQTIVVTVVVASRICPDPLLICIYFIIDENEDG